MLEHSQYMNVNIISMQSWKKIIPSEIIVGFLLLFVFFFFKYKALTLRQNKQRRNYNFMQKLKTEEFVRPDGYLLSILLFGNISVRYDMLKLMDLQRQVHSYHTQR